MNELAYFKRDQPETKQQIKSYSESIINQVQDGNVSALDVMKIVKRWEKVIENIKAGIKPEFEQEALSLPKDHVEGGFKFGQTQRTTYDYTSDSEYNDLKAKLKARETYLKNLREPAFDSSTGEQINPPMTKATVFPKMEIL